MKSELHALFMASRSVLNTEDKTLVELVFCKNQLCHKTLNAKNITTTEEEPFEFK